MIVDAWLFLGRTRISSLEVDSLAIPLRDQEGVPACLSFEEASFRQETRPPGGREWRKGAYLLLSSIDRHTVFLFKAQFYSFYTVCVYMYMLSIEFYGDA